MPSPLFINGRFLGKKTTGVERFAREIVWALDRLLAERNETRDVRFLAPRGTPAPEGLSRIGFETVGALKGHAWEQLELPRAARGGALLSLANCGPVLHRRQLVVIHDATVYRMPQNFSLAYSTLHRTLGHMLGRRAHIGTVSYFSRRELMEVLTLEEEDINVFHNGHEHILRTAADTRVLEKLGLKGRPYFLFVGSPVPNKNLVRAVRAFALLDRPDVTFVIVGSMKSNVFKGQKLTVPANVLMPGRLTDGEIVGLYKNATAMVFPSLYEGFGIPPLEAMTLGCPLLTSDIPPVREVCGDAALYFNPLAPEDMAGRMLEILTSPQLRSDLIQKGTERYPLFSWKKSAEKLWDYFISSCI